MKFKHASIGTISAIAVIWLTPASQAAPLTLAVGGLRAATTVSLGIEKVAEHVCWLKHGAYWKCRWYSDSPYYYRRYRY
jgi:hypothetical protein